MVHANRMKICKGPMPETEVPERPQVIEDQPEDNLVNTGDAIEITHREIPAAETQSLDDQRLQVPSERAPSSKKDQFWESLQYDSDEEDEDEVQGNSEDEESDSEDLYKLERELREEGIEPLNDIQPDENLNRTESEEEDEEKEEEMLKFKLKMNLRKFRLQTPRHNAQVHRVIHIRLDHKERLSHCTDIKQGDRLHSQQKLQILKPPFVTSLKAENLNCTLAMITKSSFESHH